MRGNGPGATVSLMRSGIRPGGIFPDYALPDHTGTVRSLSELQGRDPPADTMPPDKTAEAHALLESHQSARAIIDIGGQP